MGEPADSARWIQSSREPLLLLFLAAAGWLVVGSLLALIASLKFHQPALLSTIPELTYGRIQPAGMNCILYGFCLPAGLGVALYVFMRLGQTTLTQGIFVALAAVLWNIGVLAGVAGILLGNSTGFESLQMPRYAHLILFISYLMIAVCGALTFHARREKALSAPQWFALAGLFWFGWIHSTAILMLLRAPVRGVAQSVVAWWFASNFQTVWLGLIGIAALFYFLPKLVLHSLQSRYLALFTFWILIFFGSWTGIPNSAPVPAWIPSLSTAASCLTALAGLALLLNVRHTINGAWKNSFSNFPVSFFTFSAIAFFLTLLLKAIGSIAEVARVLDLTWFGMAVGQLGVLGFFVMAMFGAIHWIVPEILELPAPPRNSSGFQFWFAALGIILLVIPLLGAGIIEGRKLQDSRIGFMEVWNSTKPFIRMSTTGLLLFLASAMLFLFQLIKLAGQTYRKRAEAVWVTTSTRMVE